MVVPDSPPELPLLLPLRADMASHPPGAGPALGLLPHSSCLPLSICCRHTDWTEGAAVSPALQRTLGNKWARQNSGISHSVGKVFQNDGQGLQTEVGYHLPPCSSTSPGGTTRPKLQDVAIPGITWDLFWKHQHLHSTPEPLNLSLQRGAAGH